MGSAPLIGVNANQWINISAICCCPKVNRGSIATISRLGSSQFVECTECRIHATIFSHVSLGHRWKGYIARAATVLPYLSLIKVPGINHHQ